MYNKFDMYKKQIFMNKYFYRWAIGKKKMVMKYFKINHGYEYDFDNPVTFNEKLNTRKLEKNKLYTICADKIKVRDYVAEKIGSKYLTKLYFTSKKMTEEIYNKMPKSCVLKTSSGSGSLIIIYDKTKEDKKEVINLMNDYLKVDFSYVWGEMFYKKIKNKILCEELLIDDDGKVPKDFKFHCFRNNGDFKCFIQVDFSRYEKHLRNYYDENFKFLDLRLSDLENNEKMKNMRKPKNFDEMIEVAKKLSEDFPYVRVDLYNLNGKIYFGELTFTHSAGFGKFHPKEMDKVWGQYWE